MSTSHPIGIFDSGIGGLSVALKIRDTLPNESLIYIADSQNAPYGEKSEAYITHRSEQIARFLVAQGAKSIVVACNTATVSTIRNLRSVFSLPIIGIEPGVKPAAERSKTGIVGILATERTLNSNSFKELVDRFSKTTQVEVQACYGFVEQVEKLDLNSALTASFVKKYVEPLLEKGADTIVLGCTHYPFLIPLIEEITGDSIEIIDTGQAVANEVKRRLEQQQLLEINKNDREDHFYTSGSIEQMQRTVDTLWGESVRVSPFAGC